MLSTYGIKALWINLKKHLNVENLDLTKVLKILFIEEGESLKK